MGKWDKLPEPVNEKASDKTRSVSSPSPNRLPSRPLYSDEAIKEMLYGVVAETPNTFCTLLYGNDGTGKSGIALSYPLKEDEKHIVIDLDGGCTPLMYAHHKDKLANIIVHNPLVLTTSKDGMKMIDVDGTMDKIRWLVDYVKRNYKEDNIKALTIDGLSRLLKFAEGSMREIKKLEVDSKGFDWSYWTIRNAKFLEILEIAKSIPIDRFFIGHEDFIVFENLNEEVSKVKMETSRMVYQKIRCKRKTAGKLVTYSYIIDKSKYKAEMEGATGTFMEVDTEKKTFKWTANEIFEKLKVE